jgi:hypothetical protein
MATHFLELANRCSFCVKMTALVLGLFTAFPATFSPTMLYAQDAETKSYLLLEHGGILHGVTQPVGDQISVQLEKGNNIHVKKDSVLHIARSKVELYEYQINSIRRWGPSEHWHITQWCVQNELIEQALFHFKELSSIVEPSSKLKQLEHQIKVAILRSEPVQKYLAEQQRALGIEPKSETTLAFSQQPATTTADQNVQMASATIPNAQSSDAPPLRTTGADEINVNNLPSYVRKAFQQTITPILVQRCGQSGCHGLPGKSDFHIYQPIGEQASQTAISNLIDVLKYVDVKRPSESRLIAYATHAHGIQKHPSLNALKESDQATIARIEQWIKSIDTNHAAFSPYPTVSSVALASGTTAVNPSAISNKPNLLQTPLDESHTPGASALSRKEMLLNLRNNIGEEDPDAKLSKPAKTGNLPAIIDASEIADLERAIEKLERSETAKGKKDPFDPNEFNNRFGPKK